MQEKNLPIQIDGILILVGGGKVDKKLLHQLYKDGATIIAADGGANICKKIGIIPSAIIGDMDSLKNKKEWAEKTMLIKIAEQETTDFEKCLYSTKAPLTLAFGMSGKRLDHTLAAIETIAHNAQKRHIIMVNENDIALGLCGEFLFEIGAGERVSIYPLSVIEFESSKGLLYPLNGLTLAPNKKSSTSNKATNGDFIITPKSDNNAPYLLILPKNYLKKLIIKLFK